MATISVPSLLIENVNPTTVKVTVKYNLIPTTIEKLAGTVFSENVTLIGDDPGVATDITVAAFPAGAFAVSTTTPVVTRTRITFILKNALNEDPEFLSTGAEVIDEIVGRIRLTYAANAPTVPTLPPLTSTNTVSGAWK